MKRKCDSCGRAYEAKTKRSRYCKRPECVRERERERKRKGKKPAATVVQLPDRSAETSDAPDSATTYAAALRELREANRVDSALGQAALRLAARIDASATDSGSALAAMVRQLQQTLRAATADASVDGDPIDELRARREARQGGS